ncbi:putative prolyl 4-hydroxylase 7 [Symbiodinium microadriaticum]|uniref:Putative prolyl 4-hydroxylase 7 n=1 Tax=Symbiodinium microadriaticum TaxID=2951 RepID=A0A1Q9D3U4_SYMMI|nr:putative prolyl 4-hydroxylase 7 [Symbiodinium microadriaticum]
MCSGFRKERSDPQLRAEPRAAAHVWRRLSSCDLSSAGWLLSSSPPCRLKEDFITEEEASSLLLGLRPDALAGRARRERGGVESRAEEQLRQRVAAAVGVEESLLEPTRFVRYSREGQAFEPHVDWIVDSADPQLAQLGQRVATALIFLTDLPEGVGGETDFPALGFAVTPKKGTGLLWPNVGADGTPLPDMIHEAMPMLQDGIEKIALNVWIRDRPLPRDMTILENLLQS